MQNVIADVETLPSQCEFINSKAIHPALIGGYGSGKSAGGLFRAMMLKFKYPNQKIAIYAPTYPLLRDYWFEKLEEFGNKYNLPFFLHRQNKEFNIKGFGKIILRSMDDPAGIISYEVAHSLVDEIDLFPKDKAADRWRRILARNREMLPDKSKNTVAAMTTPEGYNFAYDRWKKNATKEYQKYRARTEDNVFVSKDYIQDLRDSYDEVLLEAYLEGNFVNLKQGSIYYTFDLEKHATEKKLLLDPTLPVNICVDFNVDPMVWIVTQDRGKENIKVLKEITRRNTNTWDQCKIVKELIPKNYDIVIYGDASGSHLDTRGVYTDYAIINKEFRGYYRSIVYRVPAANPAILSRTKCVNNLLGKGFILIQDKCEYLIEDLIQCCYTPKGEMDKSDLKRTHASEALGYYIVSKFPIKIERPIPEVKIS